VLNIKYNFYGKLTDMYYLLGPQGGAGKGTPLELLKQVSNQRARFVPPHTPLFI